MQSLDILQKYWGYTSFRPGQEEVINSLLAKKDVLAVLPTGGGKSACFQVPALMKEGLCLVISPLVALMKNQVENLLKKNIPAVAIDSSLNYQQVKEELVNAANGKYRFLYVSPERLQSKLFLEYANSLPVDLIAVDEAHCISQWGYDFRPPYLQIVSLRDIYPGVNIIALTASATPRVQEDIIEKLEIKNGTTIRESFARPNLSCSVFKAESKVNKVLEILSKVTGGAIIYCNSRRVTKEVADLLTLNKVSADFYHAGLSHEERTGKQDMWIQNKIRVIVCTNAFGMGIDKPDVRAVIHWNSPDCVENFYQESGRAGRDGLRAFSVLLYNNEDVELLKQQPEKKFPSIETVKNIYQQLGDYLQVEVGSGQGQYYDFRLDEFCSNFHLDHLTVVNVLKVLEQQGFLSVAENVFFPSKIIFKAVQEDLRIFEESHPDLAELTKTLLRTYHGIFDDRVNISERFLANTMRLHIDQVINQLKKIESFGIFEYWPQKETPQIQFIYNRASAKYLNIDHEEYLKRKKVYKTRVEAILSYLSTEDCRMNFLTQYFGEAKGADCGTCDNCFAKKKKEIGHREFELLSKNIIHIAKDGISSKALQEQLPSFKPDKIMEVITYLAQENIISITSTGTIISRK